jgi:dissimilatory sulfite reductase related protein
MNPQASLAHPSTRFVPAVWFDADGFLADHNLWSPRLAEALAHEAGIDELTAKHWEVIHLVRERYFSIGALPVMRLVCRAAGLDPQNAHKLFSSCRLLWRIAGLPNPGEEAKSYMN